MASWLKSLQISLVLTNILIILFSFTLVAVGAWLLINERALFSITDHRTELYRLPYSLILVGICVFCMAVLGIIGAITTKMIGGRILLGVYSFVLALVIFSEIATGGSALRARVTFQQTYVNSSIESLKKHNNTLEEWNKFQKEHQCCGAENYTSYEKYGYFVPESCCKQPRSQECNNTRQVRHINSTLAQQNLFTQGCPETVLNSLQRDFVVVSVVVMVVGFAQYAGVVLACLVAFFSSKEENKYEVPYSYNKLSTVTT